MFRFCTSSLLLLALCVKGTLTRSTLPLLGSQVLRHEEHALVGGARSEANNEEPDAPVADIGLHLHLVAEVREPVPKGAISIWCSLRRGIACCPSARSVPHSEETAR